MQNLLLDGLRLGAGGAIAVEFKSTDGKPLRTATVKAKGDQTETLPLYSNMDKVAGEVTPRSIPQAPPPPSPLGFPLPHQTPADHHSQANGDAR